MRNGKENAFLRAGKSKKRLRSSKILTVRIHNQECLSAFTGLRAGYSRFQMNLEFIGVKLRNRMEGGQA